MKFLLSVLLLAGLVVLLFWPHYSATVETSLAQDAAAQVRMVATTNRMYALNSQGTWAKGPIAAGCGDLPCAARLGGGPGRGGPDPGSGGCELVACGYLAKQAWEAKKYKFYALDGAAAPSDSNPCGHFPASRAWISCAVRRGPIDGDRAAPRFSSGWAYAVAKGGDIYASLPRPGAAATPAPERD